MRVSSALRATLTGADGDHIGADPRILDSYVGFGYLWQFTLPLVNETVLFGMPMMFHVVTSR